MNTFLQKLVEVSISEPFMWIKIVNACFQQLGIFCSLQQCNIILHMKVLNMGVFFRIIMLIWSHRQGDLLDFSLLIVLVISLYVGVFKSNTFKVHSVFSFKLEIQMFTFLLCVKVFLKNEWHLSVLKPGSTVYSFSNIFLQYQ